MGDGYEASFRGKCKQLEGKVAGLQKNIVNQGMQLQQAEHDVEMFMQAAKVAEEKAAKMTGSADDCHSRSAMAYFNLGLAAGGISKIKDMLYTHDLPEVEAYCKELITQILSFMYEPKRIPEAGGADGSGDKPGPSADAG